MFIYFWYKQEYFNPCWKRSKYIHCSNARLNVRKSDGIAVQFLAIAILGHCLYYSFIIVKSLVNLLLYCFIIVLGLSKRL